MAINQWLGTATAQQQIDTFTPASVGIGDIFTLTTTGFDGTSNVITYTAVDTSATTVSGALIVLWNDSASTLQTGVTATGTATVILTADTAGVAFKVSSSASGGSATFTRVATTANGGPNDWQDSDNWSLGNPPGENGAAEDTYVQDDSTDILYGLDNTGTTDNLVSLHVSQTYTGKIGWNETSGYVGDYLQVKTANLYVGENFDDTNASGSSRIKIDIGAVECSVIVYNTGNSSDTNKPAMRLLCNNASTIVREIRKGTVGIAFLEGETSTLLSVLLSYSSSKSKDSQISVGSGTTLDLYDQIGGKGTVKCALAAIDCKDGTLLHTGGIVTQANISGGTVTFVSTDTMSECNVISGICDFTQSAEPRTVSTLTVGEGATLKIDTQVVTVTDNIEAYAGGRLQYRVSGI